MHFSLSHAVRSQVYDRALLVLIYSIQFIDEVAVALEENVARHNKVGLGSSATGVVSGGLWVAAAATIFTPVGPLSWWLQFCLEEELLLLMQLQKL